MSEEVREALARSVADRCCEAAQVECEHDTCLCGDPPVNGCLRRTPSLTYGYGPQPPVPWVFQDDAGDSQC